MPTAKPKIAHLEDRGLLHVSGEDAKTLLDGLITCDLDRVSTDKARLGALLTPQGKILFDFLILEAGQAEGGGYYLDCANSILADFKKRLGFYKLRAKVEIKDASDQFSILAEWNAPVPDTRVLHFTDPRLAALGQRIFCATERLHEYAPTASVEDYHAHRIKLGVPEGGKDFAFGEAFPHEALMDQLHGVDFDKGCYVGQEVVSRMQHRGTARTRMMMAELEAPITLDLPSPIIAGEKTVGELSSLAGTKGLALVRLDRVSEAMATGQSLKVSGQIIRIKKPAFARFDFPLITQATKIEL